jgi:hypothetical protein
MSNETLELPKTKSNTDLIIDRAILKKEITLENGSIKVAENVSAVTKKVLESLTSSIIKPGHILTGTHIGKITPMYMEFVKKRNARNLINQRYSQLGGYASRLGLPTGDVVADGKGGYLMNFRGGTIGSDGNADVWADSTLRVEFWLVGLHCVLKQEVKDDIYGAITALMPSFGGQSVNTIPEFHFTHDGERIVNLGIKVYDGPPADLLITGNLVEKDNSSEIVQYKAKVEQWANQAIAAFGGSVGTVAEAMGASNGMVKDITSLLFNLVSGIFGMNDDPYTPQTINIFANDIISGNYGHYTRSYKTRSVNYTHSFDLTGIDDGGDKGIYTMFLDARVFRESKRL